MKQFTCMAMLAFAGFGVAVPANAVITTLNSGTDGAGNVLPGGSDDAIYTTLETGNPAKVITNPNGAWLPNTASSKWIWENATALPGSVTRTFRVSFDATGFDLASVTAIGRFSTDNSGLIRLNGVNTGSTCNGFSFWCNFAIVTGFVAGVNDIDFVVTDFGQPAAFRAEGAVDGRLLPPPPPVVPEPATWGLMIAGFGLVGATLRRRRIIAV